MPFTAIVLSALVNNPVPIPHCGFRTNAKRIDKNSATFRSDWFKSASGNIFAYGYGHCGNLALLWNKLLFQICNDIEHHKFTHTGILVRGYILGGSLPARMVELLPLRHN